MRKGEAPGYLIDVNDWLGSQRIGAMTAAEEGAYLRLLLLAWKDSDCSIPSDDGQLAMLSRLGEGWFNGASIKIRACFNQHPTKPQRLCNERQLVERERWKKWQEKSREGGLKSAEVRSKKRAKGGSRVVTPKANKEKENDKEKENYINPSPTEKAGPVSEEISAKVEPQKNGDLRAHHPAIEAVKVTANIYPPKALWDEMILKVGETPNLELMAHCFLEWVKKGFKPTNYAWLFDWYLSGGPTTNGGSNQQRIVGDAAPKPGKYDHLGK